MSLDVYLTVEGIQSLPPGKHIFISKDGQTKEITRSEWDRLFPGREPITIEFPQDSYEVFSANITHNLVRMAKEARIYKHLWRPEELGITKAAQLIKPLRIGLASLNSNPERFKKFDPPNGWGSYIGFVSFVASYLAACEKYPDADVSVSK